MRCIGMKEDVMSQAQIGRAQPRRSNLGGMLIAIVVAIVVIAAVAYAVMAGTRGGNAPSGPYPSAAPATGAPT